MEFRAYRIVLVIRRENSSFLQDIPKLHTILFIVIQNSLKEGILRKISATAMFAPLMTPAGTHMIYLGLSRRQSLQGQKLQAKMAY